MVTAQSFFIFVFVAVNLFGKGSANVQLVEECFDVAFPIVKKNPHPTTPPTTLLMFTNNPTSNPTGTPTNQPTNEPTNQPTNKPTNEPTNKPTNEPTNEPTEIPTKSPVQTSAIPAYQCLVKEEENFDNGFGAWVCADSGRCVREDIPENPKIGTSKAVQIRDDQNDSVLTRTFTETEIGSMMVETVKVTYDYCGKNINNNGEKFYIHYKVGDGTWVQVVEHLLDEDTSCNPGQVDVFDLPAGTSSFDIRFSTDNFGNGDYLFIDNIKTEFCGIDGNGDDDAVTTTTTTTTNPTLPITTSNYRLLPDPYVYETFDLHNKDDCPSGGLKCKYSGNDGNEWARGPEDLTKGSSITCEVLGTSDTVEIMVVDIFYKGNEKNGIKLEVIGGNYLMQDVYMKAGPGGNHYTWGSGTLGSSGGTFFTPEFKGISHVDMCVIPKPSCPFVLLDFNGLTAGDYVNRMESYGVTIVVETNSGYAPNNAAMVFDTLRPTKGDDQPLCSGSNQNSDGDSDLGTPNERCNPNWNSNSAHDSAYPGVGWCGGPFKCKDIHNKNAGFDTLAPNPYMNCEALGNVLIIQESNKLCPDDNGGGGSISFQFDSPVNLKYASLLDVDGYESADIVVKYNDNSQTLTHDVTPSGENGLAREFPIVDNANEVKITYTGSGSIAALGYEVCPP